MTARQRMALIVGGVGTTLIFLSVWHLTCGITELTQTPVLLSLLLAIGIDLGLVVTEFAELIAPADAAVGRWARRYMVTATILSAVINSYEFYHRAPDGVGRVLAVAFGISVPCFIFTLGKVAGYLWNPENVSSVSLKAVGLKAKAIVPPSSTKASKATTRQAERRSDRIGGATSISADLGSKKLRPEL